MTFRSSALALTFSIVAFAALGASQQQLPPTGTGVIGGRVVDQNGEALAGVTVTLAGPGAAPRVIVDRQGRFAFGGLPAGTFTVTAEKSGYIDGAYGKLRVDGDGRAIDLADGDRVANATITLWRTGVITGSVRDEADQPLGGGVRALRRTIVGGHWRLVQAAQTYCDDRAVYRFASLRPGDYLIVVAGPLQSMPASFAAEAEGAKRAGGQALTDFNREITMKDARIGFDVINLSNPMRHVGSMLIESSGPIAAPATADGDAVVTYTTTWYPAAASPVQAVAVSVGAGETKSGIDVHLDLGQAVSISGTVTGPPDMIGNLGLRLVPAGIDDVAAEFPFVAEISTTDANGVFTFLGARRGAYTIRALTLPPPLTPAGPNSAPGLLDQDPTYWAAADVSVDDKPVADVVVALHAGLRVTGHVAFDGTSPKPRADVLQKLLVSLEPADGRTMTRSDYRTQVTPAGDFYTQGVPPGRYFVRVPRPPAPWSLESAVIAGRDVADLPLAIDASDVGGLVLTFADRSTRIAGVVRNDRGEPDANASVLIFPTDASQWIDIGANPRRLRSARVSQTGQYAIVGLPAGDYDAIAIDDARAGNWQDPDRLKMLAALAAHVRVAPRQAMTSDLTTAVVK